MHLFVVLYTKIFYNFLQNINCLMKTKLERIDFFIKDRLDLKNVVLF